MPKTKLQKEAEVKQLKDSFDTAKSVVFTSYDGLTVQESQDLRNELRKEAVSYKASKKTLLRKVITENKLDVNTDELDGSIGVAFGTEDEVAPAKIIAKFAKAKENLKIKGGILDGQYITAEKVMALAKLPSKIELIAQVVGTINAPISGFVNVLAGNIRGLVNVLNGVKDSKN